MWRTARTTRRQFSASSSRISLKPEELDIICRKLKYRPGRDGETVNILDPYCGDGSILAELGKYLSAQGAEVCTYGVEAEKELKKKSKKITTKTVLGEYGNLRATNGTFSVLFLNPPVGGVNPIGVRREIVTFGDLTLPGKYLHTGALLICIMPVELLPSIANLLAIRFRNVELGKISDERAVIFATKTRGRTPDEKERKQKILALAENPEKIPELSPDKTHTVIPSKNPVITFRSNILDEEEMAEDIEKSSLWKKIQETITPDSHTIKAPKPLLPLNRTHIAVAAAAGVINGKAGNHYRKGITKEIVETLTVNDEDTVTRINTKRYVSRIRIFCQEGVFDLDY